MATNVNFEDLTTFSWDKSIIQSWLQEDIPSFDYGGFVVGSKEQEAILYCKETGVLAGVPFFEEIFKFVGCTVEWKIKEGTLIEVEKGKRIEIAIVRGPARKILVGERTALNMMARCAGIATKARRLANLKKKNGFKGVIAGTRKTTPGFRIVEKYGLLVGGCDQHRMDLSSMIMLKDNHIWSTGSITNAVTLAKSTGGFSLKIEVECQSEQEAIEAIDAGADIVMLDNHTPQDLKKSAESLKKKYKGKDRVFLIEASGGITEETIADYFSEWVDVISMGNLTQSVPHIDFSLKIKH